MLAQISMGIIYLVVILITIFGIYWLVNSFRSPNAAEKSNVIGYVVLAAIELFGLGNVGIVFMKAFAKGPKALGSKSLQMVSKMSFGLMGLVASMIALFGITWIIYAFRNPDAAKTANTQGYIIIASLELFGFVALGLILAL